MKTLAQLLSEGCQDANAIREAALREAEPMTFGGHVKQWASAAGLSNAELERRLGKSVGYLSRLISGSLHPTEEVCNALGALLEAAEIGVTTADVMAVGVPEAAGPWVRSWYEAQLKSRTAEDAERLLVENQQLRAKLAAVSAKLAAVRTAAGGAMTPTDTDRRLAEIVARQVTPTSIFVHAREDIAFLLSLVEGLSRELLVARSVGAPLVAAPISAEGSIPSLPCPPCEWISYDPWGGFEHHNSPEAAKHAAEAAIENALDDDNTWTEGVEEIFWGRLEVVEGAKCVVKRPRAESDPSHWDYYAEYKLVPVSPPSSPPPPAAPAGSAPDLSSSAAGSEGGHGLRPCPDCRPGREVARCPTCGGAGFVGVP